MCWADDALYLLIVQVLSEEYFYLPDKNINLKQLHRFTSLHFVHDQLHDIK